MGSETWHEPLELLSEPTRNLHRAVMSLIEELEAIDWYTQRAEACSDEALRRVILHNRDEEVEHAMMTLEWLRRTQPVFEENMRKHLFTTAAITEVEAEAERAAAHAALGPGGGSLGIGGLKAR